MSDIDKVIYALCHDILAVGDKLAINCEPERRLLALLIAYSLGEDVASKVVGDTGNP